MSSKLVVAARCQLWINGALFAEVNRFTWQSNTPKKVIRGLDSNIPQELGTTISECTGVIGVYRIERAGGAEGVGITAPYQDAPLEKYFSLMLVDRKTDTVLFEADYCSATSQNGNVIPRTYVTGNIAFTALLWNNEVRPRA